MSIQVLDPRVAQQVAAGEVVDRPASVVKELVENALDAGATRVEVELGDGGTSHILVRDDGSGMSAEDAPRSVLRHATSKIRDVSDLEAVSTLGFRGEALASVASVSAFCLTTSTGEGAGTKVAVDGGGPVEVSPTSHPKGTTILVDRLFYNVPARRAFLKGARTERAAILEVLTHLGVAHPSVSFRLAEKGRDYLSLPAARDLLERLAQVYGVAKARAMRRVEHESGPFEVSGYAALPSMTEGSRASQTVAVNSRWVRAETLTRGVDDAYRGTLPSGRYPPVALRVEVDPRRVDVNVHPTKQIVRFSEERAARAAVATAIREAIEWRPPPPGAAPRPTERPYQQESFPAPRPPTPSYARVAEHGPDYSPPARDLREVRERLAEASESPSEVVPEVPRERFGAPTPEELPERGALPSLEDSRVIGQLAAGYVLLEEPGSLWIVDQHVAHERAILDRLTDAEEDSGLPTIQALLVPEVVELPLDEATAAVEYLEELAVYGFEAEPFGPNSFRITGVISTLAGRDIAGAFKEALAAAKGTGSGRRREDHILATIACHSAVRLGDKLEKPALEALVKDWLQSRLPATCPHGRSICFRLGVNEVARKLDRH